MTEAAFPIDPDTLNDATSFVPGGHVGLITPRSLGLVARDNASTREQLWSLVANDAPIDVVLDELSRNGIKNLPDFGLVQVEDGHVRIVARGSVVVSITSTDGSERVVDPADVRTWIEQTAGDVAAISMSLPDGDPDDEAASGLNREGGFFVVAGSVPASSLSRRFETIVPVDTDETALPSDADQDVDEPVIEQASSDSVSEDQADDGADRHGALGHDAELAPEPDTADDVPDLPDDDSVIAGLEAALATSHEPTEADEPAEVPATEPEPERRVYAVLAFSNGERLPVDRSILIGRNPKITGEVDELPRILKYDGPGQGLSRTHAEIRVEGGQLIVEDMQSTNGTEVQLPGAMRQRIEPGRPTAIVYGAVMVFGDELVCDVEAPD